MIKVVVASKNPVKLSATRIAFERMFPEEEFEITGVAVESGVSRQPMTDEETLRGAEGRVASAQEAYPDAQFWVGIEGGVEEKSKEMEAFAWVIVKSSGGGMGKGRTGTFFLPPEVAKLVKGGMELGEADDLVFGKINSKQNNGAVGLLTGNAIDRTAYYVEGVVFALIPFKNTPLYLEGR